MKSIDNLGMRPFDETKKIVEALGMRLSRSEKRPFPDWVETSILSGRKAVARLVFYRNGSDGSGSLHLHPPFANSSQILAGRGYIENEFHLADVLEEIEGLLRTRLVLDGKLPYEQYPSDRSLQRWARRIVDECGRGAGRFRARSAMAISAYKECAGVAAAFDRDTAITLQRRLSGLSYSGTDEALRYIQATAISMADVPFSRHALAWETGSRDSYIAMQTNPPPERSPL